MFTEMEDTLAHGRNTLYSTHVVCVWTTSTHIKIEHAWIFKQKSIVLPNQERNFELLFYFNKIISNGLNIKKYHR